MYTREQVYFLLRHYDRLAQGCGLPARDDRLGSRPPPSTENPALPTARLKADLERALQHLPFQQQMILWDSLCRGSSHSQQAQREYAGDFWGISGGAVSHLTQLAIDEIVQFLNAGVLTTSRV